MHHLFMPSLLQCAILNWPARHVLEKETDNINADMSTMKPRLSVKDKDLETNIIVQSIKMFNIGIYLTSQTKTLTQQN